MNSTNFLSLFATCFVRVLFSKSRNTYKRQTIMHPSQSITIYCFYQYHSSRRAYVFETLVKPVFAYTAWCEHRFRFEIFRDLQIIWYKFKENILLLNNICLIETVTIRLSNVYCTCAYFIHAYACNRVIEKFTYQTVGGSREACSSGLTKR